MFLFNDNNNIQINYDKSFFLEKIKEINNRENIRQIYILIQS